MIDEVDIEALLEEKNELKVKHEELNNQIAVLKKENQSKDEKNKLLQHNINELLNESKKVEEQMDKTKRESTIVDIKIEPKFYLKGMFDHFNREKSSLCILIEGQQYFYPLDTYQCLHLPISGARVLIFNSDEGNQLIYGFDISKIIHPSKKVKVEIKSFIRATNILKVSSKEYGYLNLSVSDTFFKNVPLRLGATVILNQINIDGDYYFYINESIQGNNMRDVVLKTLLKAKV